MARKSAASQRRSRLKGYGAHGEGKAERRTLQSPFLAHLGSAGWRRELPFMGENRTSLEQHRRVISV